MWRPTDVDLCNLALGHIKANSIQSFSERSNEAIQAKKFYYIALYSVLESMDWGFARSFAEAVPYEGLLKGNWTQAFVYPSDALKVRGFTHGLDMVPYGKFEVGVKPAGSADNQRVLYTDVNAPYIVYTRAIDDPAYFSPQFNLAFSHMLASLLAQPVAGKADLVKQQHDLFQMRLLEASASDLNESIHENVLHSPDPDWITAR